MIQRPLAAPHNQLSPVAQPVDHKGRTVRAGFIRMGGRATLLVLTAGSGVILARLLTPADFGLFAMIGWLTAFVTTFRDFGFSMAAVHKDQLSHAQLSALFWINLRLNLLLFAFMALMAPALAWFYGEPRLTAIAFVSAVGVLMLGLSVQHNSLLTRQMRFGTLTMIDIVATCIGIAIGVGAALLGLGYWALVLQYVATMSAQTLITWWVSDWRPGPPVARSAMGELGLDSTLRYGANNAGFRVLTFLGRNLDTVLVGYTGGATMLGLYQNAYRWSLLPMQQVQLSLSNVIVANLSRVQHDPDAFRAYCRKGFLPILSLTMPALAFLAFAAEDFMLVVLGPQWIGAVPFFRLMCIAEFCRCISLLARWLYLSQGKTQRQLRWGLISAPIMMLAVVAGVPWGAYGIATGFTVAACLLTIPDLLFCLAESHLTLRDVGAIVWRPLINSLATVAMLYTIHSFLPSAGFPLAQLVISAVAFGLIYLSFWLFLPGGRRVASGVLGPLVNIRGSSRWGTAGGKNDPS
jgi:PST family polysaccharide transporter